MVNSSIFPIKISCTKINRRKCFVESIHVLAYKYWIARKRLGKQQTSDAEDLLYVLEKLSVTPEAYHIQTNYGATFFRAHTHISLLLFRGVSTSSCYCQRRIDY